MRAKNIPTVHLDWLILKCHILKTLLKYCIIAKKTNDIYYPYAIIKPVK